ncbi:MAG: hypothetical protein NVS3B1_29610 [Marmoricola sp.]
MGYADKFLKPEVICPHCQQKGGVLAQPMKRKKGISGGKATGAVLTGGLSMLATGLSRKQSALSCYCRNCKMRWDA